jgi:Radical SAM superfamily
LDHVAGKIKIQDVPNLTFKNADTVVQNELVEVQRDLDTLPIPAWHLFPYKLEQGFSIDVGRGCPFSCNFCSTSQFFRRRFRLKSFGRILLEAKYLRNTFGASGISLVHDLFTANRKWVKQFCEFLQCEGDPRFAWSASARIDTVDRQLLDQMAEVGCRALFYGVESGSPRMQKEIGKKLNIDTVVPIAADTVAAGIEPTLSFIAGFPTETEVDLKQTFDLIEKLIDVKGTSVQLHLMSPQAGTADLVRYRHCLKLDGFYSDISSGSSVLTLGEFADYPELFPSFFYFDTGHMPRVTVVGADEFVRLPCQSMKQTVSLLREAGYSLWEIYREWKKWHASLRSEYLHTRMASQYNSHLCGATTIGGENSWPSYHGDKNYLRRWETRSLAADEILMNFIEFATHFASDHGIAFDSRITEDDLLAFYLRFYHKVQVRVPNPDVSIDQVTRKEA